MKKILIVEDDSELREELKLLLVRNGYDADCLTDFSDTLNKMLEYSPDMVLLDINLPESDGEGLLRQFRKKTDIPVIMVTSRNTEMDELLSLSFGADDFIAKPYNPSILLLHIEAVFKRMGGTGSDILRYQGITVDLARGTMKSGEYLIELTKNELGIIGYLVKNQGRIVSRDELINYLWDSEEFVDDNTLTVNINRVRKKLEDAGCGDAIATKRGQGYILK